MSLVIDGLLLDALILAKEWLVEALKEEQPLTVEAWVKVCDDRC
jgi:hypothetical protein